MEIFYPSTNNIAFVFSLILGAVLGVFYDALIIKRHFFGGGKIILLIDDLLYTGLSGIIIVLTILKTNSGIIRWFELVSCVGGFLLYKVTLSIFVLKLFFWLSRTIKKGALLLFRFLKFVMRPFVIVRDKILAYFREIIFVLNLKIYKIRIKRKFSVKVSKLL